MTDFFCLSYLSQYKTHYSSEDLEAAIPLCTGISHCTHVFCRTLLFPDFMARMSHPYLSFPAPLLSYTQQTPVGFLNYS